jgi:hypothetical protein
MNNGVRLSEKMRDEKVPFGSLQVPFGHLWFPFVTRQKHSIDGRPWGYETLSTFD